MSLLSPVIAIGVGNTSVQIGYFKPTSPSDLVPVPDTHVVVSSRSPNWDNLLPALPDELAPNTQWIAASVFRDSIERISEWALTRFDVKQIGLLNHRNCPIQLDVKQPERVGTDRIAAAIAVNRLRHPDKPAICIDAGTALTVNAIRKDGTFLGGAIMPGSTTAGRALSKSTDQLPEIVVTSDLRPAPIGRNTDEAIQSGIFWGAIGAVKELIARFQARENMAGAEIFVTGGFGPALEMHLGVPAQLVTHLVLSGIAISSAAILGADE
ncbi:MAG: type III pantothenate kinase [Planctomycetota bacterium]